MGYSLYLSADIDPRSQNLRHLYPAWGSNWGGIRFFPMVQNNSDLSVHMNCGLSVTINMHETPQCTSESWIHFVCVVSACVVSKNPNYSQLELNGWRRHDTERYRSSEISGLYLCIYHVLTWFQVWKPPESVSCLVLQHMKGNIWRCTGTVSTLCQPGGHCMAQWHSVYRCWDPPRTGNLDRWTWWDGTLWGLEWK